MRYGEIFHWPNFSRCLNECGKLFIYTKYGRYDNGHEAQFTVRYSDEILGIEVLNKKICEK